MSQHMRFWYLWHLLAIKAYQARLCNCTGSPEPSLLAYSKYGCRWKPRAKFRPQVQLDTLAWDSLEGFGHMLAHNACWLIYWSSHHVRYPIFSYTIGGLCCSFCREEFWRIYRLFPAVRCAYSCISPSLIMLNQYHLLSLDAFAN